MKLIKSTQLLVAMAFFALGLAAPAEAIVTPFFVSGAATCAGTPGSGTYVPGNPGTTAQISLCISTTTERICASGIYLKSASAAENGRFDILTRALGTTFPDANFSGPLPFPISVSTPASTADLGGGNTTFTPTAINSTTHLATFDLRPNASATAVTTISLDAAANYALDNDGGCGSNGTFPTQLAMAASYTLTPFVAPAAPAFTSSAPPAGTINVAYPGHTFTASGNPAPTFAVTAGALPAGLNPIGAATGVLSGTPTVSGTFNFTVTATNTQGTANQAVTLIINGPPGAPTVSAAAGNTQGTLTITAPANTGGSAITGYTATCSPTAGTDASAGTTTLVRVITGLVNGTPTTCSVTATNAGGFASAPGTSNSFTPSPGPPVFTSVASTTFTVGVPGTFTVIATNSPTFAVTAGTPPAGTPAVTLTPAGVLSGTPNVAGTFPFTITATGTPPAATQAFTLTVNRGNQTIAFGAIANQPFNASPITLTATATSTLAVAFASSTPAVCTVAGTSASFVSAGLCTIVASQAGNANFNAAAPTVTQSFTVTASAPGAPTIGLAQPANLQAFIGFTPPTVTGGSPILDYTATCTGGAGGTATGTTSPLNVTGLVNGTLYTCSVTARNVTGTGPASASATVTPAPIVPPGAPVIGSASPGNTQAIIAFTPPASNGGSAITGFTATCNPGAITGTAAASPITVNGLTNNTAYTCSVTATNIAGVGAPSAPVSVTPRNVPISLTSTTITAAYGAPVTLVASVTGNGQTGTVAFSVLTSNGTVVLPGCGAVTLVAGTASCLTPGSLQNQNPRQYVASYSGDTNNSPASISFSQVVALNSAVLTVAAYPLPPIAAGRTTTLTALVKMNGPAGTVTFFDDGVPITGCTSTALALVPDATDSAVVTCTVTAPASPSGVKQYVATYFYPAGHVSGRVFEQTNFDLRVVAQGPADFTDMWWAGAGENGWGMSVTQHGPIQFNVIFAYDNLGKPLWYVMPGGSFNAAGTVFSGPLFLPTSSPFSAYDKSKFVMGAPVGTANITYTSNSTATLAYTINGISANKTIQRQLFAPETSGPNLRVNDLWWATFAEDGWGMNIAQQGRVLFPVWYTYDAAGKATFFSVQGGSWSGTVWSGTVYTHASSAWLGVPYSPSLFTSTVVGTMSLDFNDASNATMTYTVNGITQVKHIERQPY